MLESKCVHGFRIIGLLSFSFGAFALIAAHSWTHFDLSPFNDEPSVTTIPDRREVTVWTPPHSTIELQGITPHSRLRPVAASDGVYRPAILLAAVVAVYFYIWTNFEHSGISWMFPYP